MGGNLAFGLGTAHISQSFASGSVQTTGEGAGGLVGFSGSRGGVATISDSYATGQVSGGKSAGGLVGALGSEGGEARIVHAYSTGAVSGGSFVGGLVGSSNGSIESSFYATTDAQGNAINGGAAANGAGQGKTLSELTQLSTFAGWDIDDQGGTGRTWRLYEGSATPLLRGFLQQVTVNAQGSVSGKTYDGQIASGTLGFTSDTPGAVLQGQLGYASSSKNAGSYAMADGTLKFSGLYSHQQGYDITYASEMNGLSLDIDKAQLRIDGSQVVDKAYDGNTAAQVAAGRLQGLAANESLGVIASGVFDGKNAGTHGVVVTHRLVNGSDGSLASNYVLLADTRSYQGTIERKTLGIDGTQVAGKTYDGNAIAQVAAGQLQGLVGNESLGVSASGVFDSKNAGTHGATVAYDLANGSGGGLADNYVLADTKAYQATIERRALGIDGTQVAGKTYDGNAVAQVTAGQLQGLVGSESLGVSASGVFDSKNAGTQGTTVAYNLSNGDGGGLADNYVLADTKAYQATIERRALGIDGTQVANKTYDGNAVAQVTAGQLQGLVGNETLGVSASGAFDSKNAGTHGATIAYSVADGSDGSLASNYVLTDTRSYQATIERKTLGIDGTQVAGKTYDGNAVAQVTVGQLQGLVGNESLGVSASGVFDSKNAGTHGATVAYNLSSGNGGLADNYVLADGNAYQATIEPKTLSIEGTQVAGKTYDGNAVAQVSAGELQGLVGSEALGVSASGVFDSRNAGMRGATVAYTLSNGSGGGLADNYVLADTKAYQAAIERRALGIGGTQVAGKIYDGNTVAQVTVGQLQGLVGNESLGVSASGVFDGKNAGTHGTTIAYSVADGSDGSLASNYVLTDTRSYQATIERRALGIDGTQVANKTYDGNAVAQVTAGQLQGLVGNETLGVSASGVFDSRNAGQRSASVAYTLADGSGGGLAGNYLLADTTHGATIDKAVLTLDAVTDRKVYDGSTASDAAVQVTGLVGGDRIGGVSQSFDSRNAGSRSLQVDAGYAVDDGNGGNNYAVHIAGATGRIDPRALTITARDAGKLQGQALVFDGTEFDTNAGLVAGERVRSVALASEGSAAQADNGRYAIVARDAQGSGGFEAGNYAIRYVDGQLEVTNPAADIPDDIAGATLCRSQPERRSIVPCPVQQRASVPVDLPPQVPALTMTADFIRMP
ncbi:beta strand repeat-containing protein [Comamonas endophytica]|uniref:beta strand repeat-containing protein n=1 Tax=Comamonas endophytica TaxID=2949090 RepID=UPI0036195A51